MADVSGANSFRYVNVDWEVGSVVGELTLKRPRPGYLRSALTPADAAAIGRMPLGHSLLVEFNSTPRDESVVCDIARTGPAWFDWLSRVHVCRKLRAQRATRYGKPFVLWST